MNRYHSIVLVFILLALTGYLLPWIVAPASSMSLNAFDLAEWTSLHPLQRSSTIPLLAALQLRLHLLILAAIFTWVSKDILPGAIVAAVVLLAAAAQLPPPEFVGQLSDGNFRQQFALACASAILPLLMWRLDHARLKLRLTMSLAALGIAIALAGQKQADTLYRLALEEGGPGLGMFIAAGAYAGIILVTFRHSGSRVSRAS